MMIEMFQAKLHRATVTDCYLDYPGSLTIDQDLLDLSGIRVHQRVQIVNINNGERFETYTIPGKRGSGEIVVNGAAARLAQRGDTVIIIAYASYSEEELKEHRTKVVVLGDGNQVVEVIDKVS